MSAVEELDTIVRSSIASCFKDLCSGWRGREREIVSLYVMGHLLPYCARSMVLTSPTQIGIEVAVPQVRKVGNIAKKEVCKDIVIWPRPHMTVWSDGSGSTFPLSVIEWKSFNHNEAPAVKGMKQREHRSDIEWLVAMSSKATDFVGYAVLVDCGTERTVSVCRVTAGSVTERWLELRA